MPYDTIRFVPVSATDAANAHLKKAERVKTGSGLTSLQLASQVLVANLVLNDDQRAAWGSVEYTERVFDAYGADADYNQREARMMLAAYGLDKVGEPRAGTKWGVRWAALSSSNTAVHDPGLTRRVLYQCHCGYDHVVAGSKTRSNPFPFTGCLAHAEVTYLVSTQQILRIRGHLKHNDACQAACLTHNPHQPRDVRKENQRLVECRGYQGMADDRKYRWVLEKGDTRALYRKFNRLKAAQIVDKENEPVPITAPPTGRLDDPRMLQGTLHLMAEQSGQEILHELVPSTAWMEEVAMLLRSVPILRPADLPAVMEFTQSLEEVLRELDALRQRSCLASPSLAGRKRSGEETVSGHWDKKSRRG
ncbi:hypothetical protein BDZ89DRAFT_1072299 [Hymenopellis radicata]|nr:hypothetical protein BDZ89DRAFT_1072299 [Hymenopellis radicata]